MGILDPIGLSRAQGDALYPSKASTLSAAIANATRAMRKRPTPTGTPTVELRSSSTITNATVVPAASSFVMDLNKFSYFGMNPMIAGAQAPNASGIIGDNTTSSNGGSAGVGVSNLLDTRYIEYPIWCNGQAVRITLDGVEVLNTANDRAAGTAAAGGASTITLATAGSEPDGGYNTAYIFITGGTGAGQVRRCTGLVASTKVLTVDSAWSTVPDATSTYRINMFPAPFSIASDNTLRYIWIDTLARAEHTAVYESTLPFFGVNVDSNGSVTRYDLLFSNRTFITADSSGEGAGGAYSPYNAWPGFLSKRDGIECWHGASGGTGFLATNSGTRLKYGDRIVPPTNSWIVNTWGATAGGTYTLSQGGVTTGAIAWNASYTTVQTAVDAVFGAGTWKVVSHPYYKIVMVSIGANSGSTAPLTITGTGITGTISTRQFLGDIAPFVPRDVNGNVLPFEIFLQGTINDDSQTLAAIEAEVRRVIQLCIQRFPTAKIWLSGRWMNRGPVTLQNQKDVNIALTNASSDLPLINGRVPFLPMFDSTTGVGYLNGNATVAAPSTASNQNSGAYIFRDQTHPVIPGYAWMAEIYGQGRDAVRFGPSA